MTTQGRPSAVVVGASGGLGSALLDRLRTASPHHRVFAVSRSRPHGCLTEDWIKADVLREDSLAQAAALLAQAGPVSRIVVATGRLHGSGVTPEKSLKSLSLASLMELFAVNAAGPALVAKHFLPLTPRDQPSLFAALSARVGSMGDNHLGGWYSYRASKAALNMLVRTLAIEHHRTHPLGVCVALHPGTVDTGLSKPFQAGVPSGKLFAPATAAEALVSLMDRLGPEDNGRFLAWDGTPVPW